MEYRCAHCAYSVISGILELSTCRVTLHSPAFCRFYVSECVCSGVFHLLLLSSYFMGALLIDCAVLQERQIAIHSWSVTLSYRPHPPPTTAISLLLRGMATAGQTSRQGYA